MAAESRHDRRHARDRLARTVARKTERRERARREEGRSIWYSLGLFGLVGWSVAIPTTAGLALGVWIDRTWPGQVSWTITLLVAGLALGCVNAWYWVQEESRDDRS